MEYLGFIFGIFGLVAYLEISSLKKRVNNLEAQLSKIKGTEYAQGKMSLFKAVSACVNNQVLLSLKEDYMDLDIPMQGTVTLLDVDEDWMLVRIETKEGNKEKLLRLEAVQSIAVR